MDSLTFWEICLIAFSLRVQYAAAVNKQLAQLNMRAGNGETLKLALQNITNIKTEV